ncbi:flagellar hook-basal body protein [Pseudemcibacter aquimaris]|uniref:flagellar hook-basal body protein n=1 Tax=Pseudemcibacter aquimaris TaxID=2857064 RepID=UPI0020126551|nr:flagellar hook basal-body protein [Pseudemcibacter aquimaris]MCC3860813.1 flagellar hook basal-body protein [Pseudemcibacter aquimaris]WDU59633.1 flagellar hook basal-body protein [Pseudemcibacter aquimaris]
MHHVSQEQSKWTEGPLEMDTQILVSLSHQVAMRRQMDIIANNIANMNTTGYKRESIMFSEYLSQVDGSLPKDFREVSFVQEKGIARQMTNGELSATGNQLDIALEGPGMFKVRKMDGTIAFTRNGHFAISENNELVTPQGHVILDDGDAPIEIPITSNGFKVAEDGTVSADEVGEIAKIAVVEFENYGAMRKIGDNLYTSEELGTPAEGYLVTQGMLETSNVSPVLEVSNMIELSRSYASTSRTMEKLQETQSSAINKITKFA